MATQFHMGKSTCVKITRECCHALNRLSRHFIKFPVTCRETTITIALFQDQCKIPQAVGAIDGTHFEIVAPENPFDYFDRQHRHSAIMQAVDGENLIFPDTAIGYPGSMHDARVLRNTDLFRKAENGDILGEPVLPISGNHILPLLLGDGAYPLLPWLLKPYANNVALNPTQQHYSRVFAGVLLLNELLEPSREDGEFYLKDWVTNLLMHRTPFWRAAFCKISANNWKRNLMTTKFYEGFLHFRGSLCGPDATMRFDILQPKPCHSQ